MSNIPDVPKKKRFPVTLDFSGPVALPKRKEVISTKPKSDPHASHAHLVTQSVSKSMTPQQVHSSSMDALRMRMIERLRKEGVRNEQVLQAMGRVPRHVFVDTALKNQAYEDTSLPIGLGQTISKPSVVACMLEALMPEDGRLLHNVLDIGTGCGYQATVLSLLADKIYSIERLKGLHERSRANLRPLALKNVHLIYGDGLLGFPNGAPYDAIIAAASGTEIPAAWLEQMAIGGVLVAPLVIEHRQQVLIKIVRTAQGWQKMVLEAVQFVPLKTGTS